MSIATEIARLQTAKEDIKAAIESKGVTVGDGLIDTYAEKISEISGAGDSYYDTFWDAYQSNGERVEYNCAYSGVGWSPENFTPKYNMTPTDAYFMFRRHSLYNTVYDLVEHLSALGITLDFSACKNMQYAFYQCWLSHIGVVDFSSTTSINYVFAGSNKLVRIDKIIVKESNTYSLNFTGCSALETMLVEGVIGNNGFDVSPCTKLDHDSIESIVNALSTSASGLTVTLSSVAVNNAFETSEGAADGSTSHEWYNLVNTKENWSIELV